MAGPIHWGSYDGGFLEKAMAVYVAQDEPDTMRRTPASGDGGIDLLIPREGGFEVQQVKSFTGRIGSGERAQIRKSWEQVCNKPRLSKPIVAYRLVVPVDLTPDELGWFQTLTEGARWPVSWHGLVQWDAMAARHPHVTDYFFGGGSEVIAQRTTALWATIPNPSRALLAVEVATSIGIIQAALNKDDPHYRYDIRTSDREPELSELTGYVMFETRRSEAGGYVTIGVKPRHRYALEDHPIGGTATVTISDPVQAEQFRDALLAYETFGRPFTIPDGSMSGTLTAPGGLGGSFEGAGGWFGPAPSTTDLEPLRISVLDPDGRVVAERLMQVTLATSGAAGGSELHLSDGMDLLSLVLRVSPRSPSGERSVEIDFNISNLEGKLLADALPAVRVLAAVGPPNRVVLRHRVTTKVTAEAVATKPLDYIGERALQYLEDLLILQDLATDELTFPTEIDWSFAQELREYVRMLNGEVIVDSWDEITVTLNVPRSELPLALSSEGSLAVEKNIWVDVDGVDVEVGTFSRILHRARLADTQPQDKYSAVIVPGSDDEYTYRAGPLARKSNG